MKLDLRFSTRNPHSYLEGLQRRSFPNLRVFNLEMNLTLFVLTFMRHNNFHIRKLYISSDVDTHPSAPLCTFPKL
jgi:hypothetical protein